VRLCHARYAYKRAEKGVASVTEDLKHL